MPDAHHPSPGTRPPVGSYLVILAAGLSACAPALTEPRDLVQPGRYEVSLPGDGITLGGILFRPAAATPLPAVVVLHGWAEAGVPGAPRVEGVARDLSEAGIVALALSMRGWPPSGGRDDCGLRQPDDVARALEWLGRIPGVDPSALGVVGFSQGGQVALLTAARRPATAVVVAVYPVTDVVRWGETTSFESIRTGYVPGVCEGGTGRSPVAVAGAIQAPVLLVHGDADTRVPTEQSILMRDALQTAGRSAELRLVPGAGHGFTAAEWALTWPGILEFLTARLQLP